MTAIICDNCGTANPENVKFCKQCGARLLTTVEPSVTAAAPAIFTPSAQTAPAGQPADLLEKRYGTLRGIAALCKVLAGVFTVLIISIGIASVFISNTDFLNIIILIGTPISAALVYIFWRVLGESISVQLDIEENTRRTAVLLERQMK